MPDFDTRTPQEPEQPSRHTNMTLRLGIGGSTLLLAVVAVVITVRAVEPPADHSAGPSADQLDQEIQLKPPPAYELADESDSSAFSCEPEDKGYCPSVCFMVLTEAFGAKQLASINEDMITNPDYLLDKDYGLVLRIQFLDKSEFATGFGDYDIATSYCFKRKSVAVSALQRIAMTLTRMHATDTCLAVATP